MPTPQEFESQISSGISLVHFHNSDGSNKIFDKLATQYHNVPDVKIFNVDCGQEDLKGLCENEEVIVSFKNVPKINDFFLQVEKYPTFILYKNGDRRANYQEDPTLDKFLRFVHKYRKTKDEL